MDAGKPAVGNAVTPGRPSHCWILFPDGYIGVAPTVRNLAEMLGESGVRVEIFGWHTRYPDVHRLGPNVVFRGHQRPWDLTPLRLLERVLLRIGLRSLVQAVDLGWFVVHAAVASFARARSTERPAILGVDRIGAITARVASVFSRTPFGYLSLELPSNDWLAPLSSMLAQLDRAALKGARFIAIQDAERLETLQAALGYKHPHAILVPNAPRSAMKSSPGSNWLRQRLGISESEFPIIVLQAGMIEDATYARELARAFYSVGAGRALALHERIARHAGDPYIRLLRHSNPRNLFLSLEPVDIDDLDSVYASASIGMAFYRPVDANFSQIAMASGKVGYYLKHGLPILTNDIPSLARLVRDNGIGAVVSDPSNPKELDSAIDRILHDYEAMSSNARRTFSERFDFDRYARPVVDQILAG